MKILIPIFLLCLQLSFAQNSYIAVITNPEIGPQSNAMNLIEVVADINAKQNIAHVVVLGNITANGKLDEFIWAQEILDELTVPYFVVGGEKDYLLSEGKGNEISLLWGDDNYFLSDNNFSLVCVSTFLPEFPKKRYIDIETLNKLKDNFSANKFSCLFTFSYHPVQSAENSSRFFEMTLDKKLFSFVSKEDKSIIAQSMFEGLYLTRKDGWGYLLVSTKNDSLYIKKMLSDEIKKKAKPETIRTTFTRPLLLESKKQETFIAAGSKEWTVNVNKIILTPPVYKSDNIFSVFKNGLVLCLNGSGKEKWRFETNEKITSSAVLENDLLVIASDDGDIITLNSNNGNPHQIIGIGERITSGVSIVEIDERGDKFKAVVVGTEYGNLYCYDLFTLDPVWTGQVSSFDSDLRVASLIACSNNKIFFQDNVGTLYCFTASNGLLIWKLEASKGGWRTGSESPGSWKVKNILVQDNNLFLIDSAGDLFCIDALLGIPKWNVKSINANGLITTGTQNELILPTTKNKLTIVSTKLGKVTSEIQLPPETKDAAITDLLSIGDKILVSFSDGWVYKIKLRQKSEKFFRGGLASAISLRNVDGNCLITDYDGRITLLKVLN
jgi:outer membrane protein assembly factor BamB